MAQIERETFMDSIKSAEEQLCTLRRRIEVIAEHLCGDVPETDSNSGEPVNGGLLGAAESAGYRMREQIREANEALSRIEDRLPSRTFNKRALSEQDKADYAAQIRAGFDRALG